MMEEELIQIWQSSPEEEQIKFHKSRLILDVQSKLDRFHKAVKYRDLIEIGTALLLIPLFAYQVYAIPFTLSKIACAFIVLWLVYVIFRLRSSKKHKPSPFTEAYLDYLYKSRDYLEIQKRLIDTVLYWYILPCLSAVILFVIGIHLGGKNDTQALLTKLVIIVFTGLFVYWINKRAVRKNILPKLKKIEELIRVLKE